MKYPAHARTTIAHRLRGACGSGHPIIGPGFLLSHSGRLICRRCIEEDPQFRVRRDVSQLKCVNGLHPRPPEGSRRCLPCKRLANQKSAASARARKVAEMEATVIYPYGKLGKLPPTEVLDYAACSPDTASLFDLVTREDQTGRERFRETQDRVAAAKAICAVCPVRAACLKDATENRRLGVFGGQYLSLKWHLDRLQRERSSQELPESA